MNWGSKWATAQNCFTGACGNGRIDRRSRSLGTGGHLAMLVNTTLISIVSHTSQYSFQSFKRLDTSAFSLSQSLVLFFLFFFSQFFLLPLYFFVFFFSDVLNWDEDSHDVMTDVLCCNVAWSGGVICWLLSLMCFVLVLLYLMNLLLWFL